MTLLLIDELMPTFDVDEIHRRRVGATCAQTMAAARDVTVGEIRLLGPLMAIRALPMRAAGHDARLISNQPVLQQFLDAGFILLGESPDELVLGEVGQPWRLTTTPSRDVTGHSDFAAFTTPGFAKVTMNFSVVPHPHGCLLSTQTRVHATDPTARRAFARYWRVVSHGSAAIRRSWLAAIARRAHTTP